MKKTPKGNFGYVKYEKKKRLCITLFLFAVPLLIFFTGLFMYKSRLTVFTVIAILGCLPACKSMVGLIMMFTLKSIPEEEYDEIKKHGKDLTVAYELLITTYDKNTYLDSVAVCGNTVIAFSSKEKNVSACEEYMVKILRGNGFKVSVKIFTNQKSYLERLDSLYMHREAIEKDIKFIPDEKYPELSRNELIKHTILAIAL